MFVDLKDLLQYESYGLEKSQPKKFDKMLIFKHRVYRMRCTACSQWGTIYMYKPLMEAFTHLFCLTVAEILNKVPPRKPGRKL